MKDTRLTPPPGFRGAFRTDAAARAVYAEAAGIARILPAAVAVPANEDDVAALVRAARDWGVPLVPRGSGSSMAGGALGTGVVVDMGRLRALGTPDPDLRLLRVGPGVLCAEADAAARAVGLRFPVDPSSARFCTIGGMAATNAAGSHSMALGAMASWVNGLRCVFADGDVADVTRGQPAPPAAALDRFAQVAQRVTDAAKSGALRHVGVRKESSGYGLDRFAHSGDVVDVLVGSEGTLALFTEVELRLAPLPGATASLLGAFASLEDAVHAATVAREAGAVACELLDRTFLEVAASGGAPMRTPATTESALLIAIEADTPDIAAGIAREIESGFHRLGAIQVDVALDAAREHELWELRHAASPTLARLDPRLKSMQFIEDAAVPPDRLPAYVRGVRAALDRRGTRGVIFGHAGDGHVHVNPLVDVSRPDWRAVVSGLLEDVTALVHELGGTLTGEHGDGRLRTPLLGRVWPAAALECFALVKQAFDPRGILNPGVKLAEPGQQPLGEIKYDPALPAADPTARAALATVERERAYSRSRLDLLGD